MRKILLVDDDPEVGLLLKTRLEKAGEFEVVLAFQGEEAIRLAESSRPDIIVCDVDMPDPDVTAVATALEKQEATKKLPFLFLTSLATPNDVARGVKAGGKTMLSKQSPIDDLIKGIDD